MADLFIFNSHLRGIMISALGCQFATYLDVFKPFLVTGLQNHEEGQVCSAAIGVLVDLCRALEAALMPHLDEFMGLLFQIVQVCF